MPRRRTDLDADLLALHRRFPERYPFLLESVAGHPQSGRWDLLFAADTDHLAFHAGRLASIGGAATDGTADFFAALDAWQSDPGAARDTEPELPFQGGWFLLLGYEMAATIETRLRLPASPFPLPDALAVRCRSAVLRDRTSGATWLVSEDSEARLDALARDLADVARESAPANPGDRELVVAVTEEDSGCFTRGIERIQDYLRDGDVFQVNLSRAWQGELADRVAAADLYDRLRRRNPAPFAGLAHWRGATVLSSSPERLVEVHGSRVQTRPIAGTRPRAGDAVADLRQREQLVRDAKERAEHIMLIDLERNDLGRVCEPGSVKVSELMTVESYAHVHHIVSNVRGRLRPGVRAGAVLRAVFPGGTISGCPKVRAMEIIAELEGRGRGPYTGSMGYLGVDGRLDANILIRSLVCAAGRVTLRAGAGIVADSNPRRELEETRAKARGLLAAFGAQA